MGLPETGHGSTPSKRRAGKWGVKNLTEVNRSVLSGAYISCQNEQHSKIISAPNAVDLFHNLAHRHGNPCVRSNQIPFQDRTARSSHAGASRTTSYRARRAPVQSPRQRENGTAMTARSPFKCAELL